MLGWEDVTYLKLPLYLAGSMPLRAMVGILELIIRYQVEIQKSQPTLMEQTFQFMDCVFTIPTEGAKVDVANNEDCLMGSYSYVYHNIVKKAMQILHVSPSNMIFGSGNLIVVVLRVMGHYKENFTQKAYVAFNAKDFSLPGRYTKKEHLEAEKHFHYKSRLEPSESGEILDNTTKTLADITTDTNTQAGPSNPIPIPGPSPLRDPSPTSPPSPPVRKEDTEDSWHDSLQNDVFLPHSTCVDSPKHQDCAPQNHDGDNILSGKNTRASSVGVPTTLEKQSMGSIAKNSAATEKTVTFKLSYKQNSSASSNKSTSSKPQPTVVVAAEEGNLVRATEAAVLNDKATSSNACSLNRQSLVRVGPRLRAEGLMVPPASDAATLRRQVAALQVDLEAHIEAEKNLESINQQLRDRLELYMKQNHENVERAEKELNTLHEDMQQTLELQSRLAQRASALEKEKKDLEQAMKKKIDEFDNERSALQAQISKLSEDLSARQEAQSRANDLQAEVERTLAAKSRLEKEIEGYCQEVDSLKKKTEEYSNELQVLMFKERQNQLVEGCSRKPLLRRTLRQLHSAVQEKRFRKAAKESALEFYRTNCCYRGILALQSATIRSKFMRKSYDKQAKACLRDCWKAWYLSRKADKMSQDMVMQRQKSCACNSFKRWRVLLKGGKLSEDEERRLSEVAKDFRSSCLQRYTLRHWIQWIENCSRPEKAKLNDFKKIVRRLTFRQVLSAWKSMICARQIKNLKLRQVMLKQRHWHKKRVFRRWQEGLHALRQKNFLMDKASQYRNLCSCRSFMRQWCKFLQIKRRRHISKDFAFRHFLRSLEAKVLLAWRHNLKIQKAELKARLEGNQALLRAALSFWRDYRSLCAIRKKKEIMAQVHVERRTRKIAKSYLVYWWEEMAWKRRALQLKHFLAARQQYALLATTFHGWVHITFDDLLSANVKIHQELQEAKEMYEDQKHQTTAVDVENLQLIDRLQTMSSEIAFLKMTVAEKEKQEEDLHRALEDGAFIESSLRGELEQYHIRIEELEIEIDGLQRKLQMKNAEDTAGEVHHTLEIQNLKQALNDLQAQLAQKNSEIESFEKDLKDMAEKLEGTSDESQQQLNNAFAIANSLRKLLEDRESQYASLEGDCRLREAEVGEVQRMLATANNTFAETIEARDARIRELEAMIARKQGEVKEAQQKLESLELVLDAKDSLVRKLEYEIKLNGEQESQRTRNFVTSLGAWPPASHCKNPSSDLRSRVHSIEMRESMRHVYTQAKAALLQEREEEMEISNELEQCDNPSVMQTKGTDLPPLEQQVGIEKIPPPQPLPSSHESKWETSFSLIATTIPSSSISAPQPPQKIRDPQIERSGEEPTSSCNGSLNVDIQRLQARIMGQLTDPSDYEESLKGIAGGSTFISKD